MKILKGVWTALALTLMLASPARADDPPQYVGSLSVTDTTDDVAFINNHSGGDDAPFLAKSITITATGDTCYLDHTDTLSNSLDLAGAAVATEDDIPIVAGEPYVINLGSGYNAPAGWAGLAGICGTGDTATWTITANRYDVPDVDITIEGGEGAGDVTSDGDNTLSGNNSFTAANQFSGVVTFGSAPGAANSFAASVNPGCINFEGATNDAVEADLCVVDPTVSDGSWLLPNPAGAAVTLGGLGLAQAWTARNTFGSAADAANAIDFNVTAGGITFEGSGADGNELTLVASNPAGDVTVTIPATTTTLAGLAANQSWTGTNTFATSTVSVTGVYSCTGSPCGMLFSGSAPAVYMNVGALTPDGPALSTGTTSNTWHVAENGTLASNLGNGMAQSVASTQPGFIIHGAAANTTEFNHLNVMGSHGGNVTALTDDTAGQFFHTVTMGSNGIAYSGDGHYTVYVTDAAGEVQQATGNFLWTAQRANTGGSVCSIQHVGHDGVLGGLPLKQLSAGTLDVATNGLECNIATNVANFTMRANTSLTATTFTITSQVNVRRGPAEIVID